MDKEAQIQASRVTCSDVVMFLNVEVVYNHNSGTYEAVVEVVVVAGESTFEVEVKYTMDEEVFAYVEQPKMKMV